MWPPGAGVGGEDSPQKAERGKGAKIGNSPRKHEGHEGWDLYILNFVNFVSSW